MYRYAIILQLIGFYHAVFSNYVYMLDPTTNATKKLLPYTERLQWFADQNSVETCRLIFRPEVKTKRLNVKTFEFNDSRQVAKYIFKFLLLLLIAYYL